MAEADKAKQFNVPTTAQVERVYRVAADSPEQAHKRLRAYLADPEMIGEGIVEEIEAKNTSDEQVKKAQIKEITGPKPVEVGASAGAGRKAGAA